MIDHGLVQLAHRHGQAATAGFTLTRFRRAGVVAILAALARPQRHGPSARPAEAYPGEQRWTADRAGWHPFWATRLQSCPHRLELCLSDDQWHFHDGVLCHGLGVACLVIARVKPVLADIGRAGEDLMHRSYAEFAAIARADTAGVQVVGDRLDPHRPTIAFAPEREPIDQPDGLGVDWIDLELLLDLCATLLSRHDPITQWRKCAVPKPLPRILVHRAQGVLGVLLRLILVKKRHDLPHHHAHWVIAEVLRDRNQADAILRQLADVELKLELIAEKARKRMDYDKRESRRLDHRGIDHCLE